MKNQTITLGDFELTAISDGTYVADGGAFFGIIPKVMWQRKVPADDLNRITVSCNSVLVRTGKQNSADRNRHRQQDYPRGSRGFSSA